MTAPPLLRPPVQEPASSSCRLVGAVASDSRRPWGRIGHDGIVLILLFLALAVAAAPASAFQRVGLVLLHGKTGSPAQFSGMTEMLTETGYGVEAPEMCWSGRRIYDRPLTGCFADIDAAVTRLRADGFTAIVVGGHSLGGLVALAYAATHEGLAGVVLLAPDGEPTDFSSHTKVAESVRRAEAMVKAGQSDEAAEFTDRVLGGDFTVKATPSAFLSFIGPDSPLLSVRLLPNLHAPLFWAAGTKDSSQRDAAALFRKAPAKPNSRFLSVRAGHMATPGAALVPLLDWLGRISGN